MMEHSSLLDILLGHTPESRSFYTEIKGFSIARRDTPHKMERCMINPVVIVTVQGKKRSVIGKVSYEYEAGKTVVLGMDIPADSCVLEASPEKPYLSMILELDAALIAQILSELPKEDTDAKPLCSLIESTSVCLEIRRYTILRILSAFKIPYCHTLFLMVI